jgi:hypothetical protein
MFYGPGPFPDTLLGSGGPHEFSEITAIRNLQFDGTGSSLHAAVKFRFCGGEVSNE